jgi:hypothetical protein
VGLMELVIVLVVVGVLLWLVETIIPMDATIKTIIRVVVIVVVVLWLLRMFVGDVALPTFRR